MKRKRSKVIEGLCNVLLGLSTAIWMLVMMLAWLKPSIFTG